MTSTSLKLKRGHNPVTVFSAEPRQVSLNEPYQFPNTTAKSRTCVLHVYCQGVHRRVFAFNLQTFCTVMTSQYMMCVGLHLLH